LTQVADLLQTEKGELPLMMKVGICAIP
jgi:hypothetical protein